MSSKQFIMIAGLVINSFCSISNAEGLREQSLYGGDNRLDLYQVSDPKTLEVADSAAIMLQNGALRSRRDGTVQIVTEKYGKINDLCKDEPYWSQPAVMKQILFFSFPNCSAFLVGPDLIATAGHCFLLSTCGDTSFAFGYKMASKDVANTKIPQKDVYQCKEIVDMAITITNGPDYALVKLDRPVVGHAPVKLARLPAQVGESVNMAGYPMGLPLKIAGTAKVRNVNKDFFVSNLNSFNGNSGSVVYRETTGEALGILVRGDDDYVDDNKQDCQRSKVCPPDGCKGESSTDIAYIINAIDDMNGSRR